MNWTLRLALRLYPRWWQRRYGRELETLVGDLGSGWAGVFDIARGAFIMQIREFRTIPLLAALVGASIGTLVYLRSPALYASTSTIRLPSGSGADPSSSREFQDLMGRVLPSAEARASTWVIRAESGGESSLVRISHKARDSREAQAVVERLVAAAVSGTGDSVARATVVAAPDLPTTPRRAHSAASVSLGAGLGLVFGTVLVVLRKVSGAH